MKIDASGDMKSGIILKLGDFHPASIISESALATLLEKSLETIRRWRRKGELPDSVPLGKNRIWTAQCLIDHFAKQLEELARKRREQAKRLNALGL